jgi:ATP/maltotriose-dependent transcriptional regulator MalT
MHATATGAEPLGLIERPRLLAQLDGAASAGARAICLVAPAGYGKTVLAEGWARSRQPSASWHYASDASRDVGLVAVELAAGLERATPGIGAELLRVLRTASPEGALPARLAILVARRLRKVGATPWVVIDDYQYLHGSPAAELVEALVRLRAVRLLLTARVRPAFATARAAVYGDVAVVGREALRFDDAEARAVAGADATPELDGWPVLVALSARAQAHARVDAVDDVFAFVAEDVFGQLAPADRETLALVSLLPSAEPAAARFVAGSEADRAIARAVGLGLLPHAHRERSTFHPLVREFLHGQFERLDAETRHRARRRAFAWAMLAREWDAAYEVAASASDRRLLERLLWRSYEAMIDRGRSETVRLWAEALPAGSPLADLVNAELDLAVGQLERAIVLAKRAAAGSLGAAERHRALHRVGRISMMNGDASQAREYYERAAAATPVRSRRTAALWSTFCVAALSLDGTARDLFARFEAEAPDTTAHRLRRIIGYYNLADDVATWRRAYEESIAAQDDTTDAPNVRRGFQLCAAERFVYAVDLTRARRMLDALAPGDGAEYAHVEWTSASIEARLEWLRRRFHRVEPLLDVAERGFGPDDRLIVQTFRVLTPLALGEPVPYPSDTLELAGRLPWCVAQVHAWSALLAAAQGDADRVEGFACAALGDRAEIFVRHAVGLARGIAAPAPQGAALVVETARSCVAAVDFFPLVAAYRARPDVVLPPLLADGVVRPHLVELLNDVDVALARELGVLNERITSPLLAALSPREREVLDLLAEGLTNPAIARRLFISPATAKLHVRRILAKLDVTSRHEAVALATARHG